MASRGRDFVRWGGLATALALVVSTATCVVSPQPLPPGPLTTPLIDLTKLALTDDGTGTLHLHGDPGAVTANSTLSTRGPSAPASAVEAAVADDGSFDAEVPSDPANLYRLEAELHGVLSAPLDLTFSAAADGFGATKAEPPLAGCLTIDPPLVFDAGDVAVGSSTTFAVEASNGCTEDVDLSSLALAFGDLGFEVDSTAPVTIAAGTLRAVTLHFAPSDANPVEDLLVVGVSSPSANGFLLVTLRGQGF